MDPSLVFQIATYVLTASGSLLAAGWFSAIWIGRLRDDIKETINIKVEKLEDNILRKLEYHERHDDERFSQLQNDLWNIRVNYATLQNQFQKKKE